MHPNQDAFITFHEQWKRIAQRRRFAPTRSVDHYRAWADPASGRARERKWVRTCADVEDHVARFGTFPHTDGRHNGTTERRLAHWIRYQRRAQDSLSGYQRGRLELLPGWAWEPREERWLDWLTEYEQFVRQTRRRPRRSSNDPLEARLAIWHRNQSQRLAEGRLDDERESLLRQLDALVRRLAR